MSDTGRDGATAAKRSRGAKRTKRRLTCSFSIGGQFYRGITVDLSPQGLFIQTDATAAPGSRIAIDLIGTGRSPDVHVRGVIARRRAVPAMLASAVRRGIGVKLTEAPREYGLLFQGAPLEQPISPGREGSRRSGATWASSLTPLTPLAEAETEAEEESEAVVPTTGSAPLASAPSQPPAPATPALIQPDVLLMDDGSLGELSEILAQVGAEGLRIRTTRGSSPNAWVRPRRLLITPASLALSFPWPECSAEEGFVGIAIADDDSQTLSTRIARLGFQHLVRRSIHPETLRCLLRQLLYRGPERRRVPRFALDCGVASGSGLRRSRARLVELSVRGCRLSIDSEVPALSSFARITLLPDPVERGLTLRGRVVRRERNPHEGGQLSLAIGFDGLSVRARRRLDALLRHCAEGHVHPMRSRLSLAPFLVPSRGVPSSLPARTLAAECGLLGSDLSINGVHASSLQPGLRFALELFEGPYCEPLRIGAEVFEQDDAGTLGLRFLDSGGRSPGRGSS